MNMESDDQKISTENDNIFEKNNEIMIMTEQDQLESFRVLVVDDSPYNLFVMEELLKQISQVSDI